MRLSRALVAGVVVASCLATSRIDAKLSRSTKVVAGSVQAQGLFTVAGDDGATLALGGEIRIRLAAGTVLRQLPATDLRLGGSGTTSTYVFVMKSGRVDVEGAHDAKSQRAVMVRGPKKLGAIIRDGRATLLGTATHATVANYDATVLAGVGDDWDSLAAGQVRAVGGPGPEERALPSRPAWTAGRQLWLTREETASVSNVSWTASGATHYEVTIRPQGQQRPPQIIDTTETRLKSPIALKPGRYSFEVRGFDADDLESPPSPPFQVGIIRVQPPPGGYFDPPHAIRLPPGHFVDLMGAEGLEMSYAGAKHWTPAASRLWLTRNEPLEIQLRTPGSQQSLPLTLAPRGLSADVTLGPKNATWPSVPAQIEVQLVNDHGQRVPEWLEPQIDVRLGTEPIQLSWKREGDVLRATVPPRSSGGPWVLRVAVNDQHGIELGRNFLEIAKDDAR